MIPKAARTPGGFFARSPINDRFAHQPVGAGALDGPNESQKAGRRRRRPLQRPSIIAAVTNRAGQGSNDKQRTVHEMGAAARR